MAHTPPTTKDRHTAGPAVVLATTPEQTLVVSHSRDKETPCQQVIYLRQQHSIGAEPTFLMHQELIMLVGTKY